jgi:hypothetical protein
LLLWNPISATVFGFADRTVPRWHERLLNRVVADTDATAASVINSAWCARPDGA